MADAVTTQTLLNGNRHLVMKFTNLSDGTGETGVKKVDAASATNGVVVQGQTITPGVHLKVTKVKFDVAGMALRVQWDASSAQDMMILAGYAEMDFRDTGGIQNPGTAALAGSTGSILFTTVGQTSGSSYTVELVMTKGIPQS